jgi:hypothetical protein
MPWLRSCLTLATLSLMLGATAKVAAQTPASYTYDRAYRHFLNSRYAYRTLYSSVPAAGSAVYTPFLYQSQYVEPGFSRQRITPYAYERFDAVPGFGGMTLTPFGFNSYYVPRSIHGFYAPYGLPGIEYTYP